MVSRGKHPNSAPTQFKSLERGLLERFEDSYIPEPNSGCWLWIAGLDTKGYGRITVRKNKPMRLAHRVSWELFRSKTQKFILHKCDVPCCVNPDHLYPGTQLQNVRDCVARGRRKPPLGEQSGVSKLTVRQVVAIRADARSQRLIALDYDISQSQVSHIKQRKRWGHLA